MATVFRGMAGTMFNATWSVTDDAIEVKGKGTFKFSDISSARNTPPSARWKNGVVMVTTKTGRSLVLPYKYDQTAEAGEAYRAIAAGAGMIKDAGSSDSRTSYVTPELAQQRQKTGGLSGGTIRVIIVAAILLLVGLWIFSGGKGGGGSRNTCKVCGRSWPAGDSGGNYMSIARSGMCVSCHNNYDYSQSMLEK